MEPEVRREIILDNYSNPFHKESKGEDFKTANANNSSCIDNINIFIKFDGNIIKDAYFDGEACAISTSAAFTTNIKVLQNNIHKLINSFFISLINSLLYILIIT